MLQIEYIIILKKNEQLESKKYLERKIHDLPCYVLNHKATVIRIV